MDCLPIPLNPLHPPLEVPATNLENYDGGDFHTYPERQGWGERSAREWNEIFRSPSPVFVAFLERWLLFGMIHIAFTNQPLTPTFIRYVDEPPRPVLTMKRLPSLLRWFNPSASFVKALSKANFLHLSLAMSKSMGHILKPSVLSSNENLIRF